MRRCDRHSLPSRTSSAVPVTTSQGVGKIALWVHNDRQPPHANQNGNDRHGGQAGPSCNVDIAISRARAPAPERASDPRPTAASGYGSTTMVIWPLACAVQANWYSAAAVKRQPKALPGHHQGRPENLRHVVRGSSAPGYRCSPRVRRMWSGRISTFWPAMRRAQVPFGITKTTSCESTAHAGTAPPRRWR